MTNSPLISDLNAGQAPDSLRQALASHEISLSESTRVMTQETDRKWQISDGGREYSIVKDDQALIIYRGVSDLDQGQVPEPLRQGFESNEISLDSDKVAIQEEGKRWQVSVGSKEYSIVKEVQALNIYPVTKGYILVEDDGIGMGWEEIKTGWLTISSSPKREMKRKGQTTAKGRTPIGDKGLGRLGTQRLGRYLEFWSTKREPDAEFYVGLDWGNFRDKLLPQVPVYIAESKGSGQGTRLLVSGLRASKVWSGGAQDKLANQLSQLISPFEALRQLSTCARDGPPMVG